ncbi:hypothetical protein, partial [Escherichia coli]|uniref:hypothetical protein n=1 Tax=Escherichia coli TaxID=562 RepID=UPI00391831A3
GLTTSDTGNKIKNLSMMFLPFSAPCIVLIPCLSAVSQEQTARVTVILGTGLCARTCRAAFYDTHPVIIFQDIDN